MVLMEWLAHAMGIMTLKIEKSLDNAAGKSV